MSPKEARKLLGLTQAKMAALMGVHIHTFIKWESGERIMAASARRLLDTLMWLVNKDIVTIHQFGEFIENIEPSKGETNGK